jgi:hypothetical protein
MLHLKISHVACKGVAAPLVIGFAELEHVHVERLVQATEQALEAVQD